MTTMQRWELSAFGSENLSLVSAPRPVPGADAVLVEVEAVLLNFRDSLTMENRLGAGYSVPLVPGSDLAGTVVEVGSNVARLRLAIGSENVPAFENRHRSRQPRFGRPQGHEEWGSAEGLQSNRWRARAAHAHHGLATIRRKRPA